MEDGGGVGVDLGGDAEVLVGRLIGALVACSADPTGE